MSENFEDMGLLLWDQIFIDYCEIKIRRNMLRLTKYFVKRDCTPVAM